MAEPLNRFTLEVERLIEAVPSTPFAAEPDSVLGAVKEALTGRADARSLTAPARAVVLSGSRRGTLTRHDGLRRVVQETMVWRVQVCGQALSLRLRPE